MTRFYKRLLEKPARHLAGLVVVLLALAAAPFLLVVQLDPPSISFVPHVWDKGLSWATLVLQIGGFMMVTIGALIPIMKWWSDAIEKIVEHKPIVITDICENGYEIMNVGGAPAVNVWLVVEESGPPIPLGALNANESRPVPPAVVATMKRNVRHLLIAASRPNTQRPYTPTFNVVAEPPVDAIVHGFFPQKKARKKAQKKVIDASLTRGGSIDEYLHHERKTLLTELNEFSRTVRKDEQELSLDPDVLLQGCLYALEQCGLLITEATALLEGRRYPTARGLALFASEELGRHEILLECWRRATSGTTVTRSEVARLCRDHVRKQHHGQGALTYRPEPGDPTYSLIQERMNAFYLDLIDNQQWARPITMDAQACADDVADVRHNYALAFDWVEQAATIPGHHQFASAIAALPDRPVLPPVPRPSLEASLPSSSGS